MLSNPLTRKAKEDNWREFTEKELTWPTHAQLCFLYTSYIANSEYVKTELDALLQQRDLSVTDRFNHIHVLRTLMVIVETLLAMIFVLSRRDRERLKSFAYGMLRYDQNQIDQVIDGVRNRKLDKRGFAVFGFPKLKTLSLTKEGHRFVYELFVDISKHYFDILCQLSEFYDNNRNAYGKLKHGLMFNFSELNSDVTTGTKIIVTFDRNEKNSLRGQYYRPPKNPSPPGLDWFNVLSMIPQDTATYQNYMKLNDSAVKLAQWIIENYIRYSTNCGQNYLPVGVEEILRLRNESDRLVQYESIKKILQGYEYTASMKLDIIHNFKSEAAARISADFAERHVSVHWYPKSPQK